jgi:NADPH:quinone reductase-like Zn-dependent oxidoreductase
MSTQSSKTAKVVRFTETGGPEVLKIENLEIPGPAAQEVRIQVKAIGLNRADTMFRSGFYIETPKFPSILGYEAAGTIESLGTDVQGFSIGDKVNVIGAFSLKDYGTYGELINVPAYTLQRIPANLSYKQAASTWTNYLTAYGLLIEAAKIKAGQHVLITAASSSAGLAAIQVVNMVGATSIAVTTTVVKKEALLKAGAKHVIVTAEQDIVEEVQKITEGKGADVILDPVGGPLFAKLISAVAERGQVFIYGAMSQEPTPFPIFDILMKCPIIKGYTAFEVIGNPPVLQSAIEFINGGIASGKLVPIISRTFTLDEVVEAHQFMEGNQHTGKIVLTV